MDVKVVEIAFVGYSVTDLKRARRFYEGILGLVESRRFGESENAAWVEYDIGPTTLGITNMMPDWLPSSSGGIVAFEVEDFDSAIARLKQEGAPFIQEPVETPVCHLAVVKDPDGNAITVHKRKTGHT